ncbi:MAG: DNA topoisomerase (ATP-hydrolyzing) [Chloroflexota bacterium]
MEIGMVQRVDIDEEMQQAYMDYAMSVIVSRALPDARDGLKPVHRRILYAMHEMGIGSDSPYKKSARIVGEVLGKFHPHGDMAVYDAMARMAQDFSMRYLLVDGQGNFGSMDGDPPAAMRYTEARIESLAGEMLNDIHKDTVDFVDNFDGTLLEPVVLPAAVPNLMVNGGTGIAVGYSSNIPPHNLGEIVDALIFMLERWTKLDDVSVEDLMRYIKGPDFPTGGVIIQGSQGISLTSAYGSGRGRITLQARVHLEDMERGRKRIVVSQLPYMTNKASLIERIAQLSREGHLEGLSDLRDESDRQGLRIVLELTKTADPEEVLKVLYSRTSLQMTFGIIMLALVDGEPRLLSLKQALRVYLEHRLTVVRRRSKYELDRARKRAHVLEGLQVALDHLDEVINTIRQSPNVTKAHSRLRRQFKLTEEQASAILDLPLRRLASLERKKITSEYKELLARIKKLVNLLASPKKIRNLVAEELSVIKSTYADRRRTHIVTLEEDEDKSTVLTAKDVVTPKVVWVSVTAEGLVSCTRTDKKPRISGTAAPRLLVRVHTHDTLYLVNLQGEAAPIAVHSLPVAETPSDGVHFARITPLPEDKPLASIFSPPAEEDARGDGYILTFTKCGMVKKTDWKELPGPSAQTFTLARVNEGDCLGWVGFSRGQDDVFLVTADGMCIRFNESDVRPMGLIAAGVGGIKLRDEDCVVGGIVLRDVDEVFFLASDGGGKRVALDQVPTQGRYGLGVIAWKLSKRQRLVGVAVGKGTHQVIAHLKKRAAKSTRLDAAPLQGRMAGGKEIIPVKAGDQIVVFTDPLDMSRFFKR